MKRLVDILFSFLLLIVLSPLLLIVAIIIKLTSKGPVFFTQDRIGKDNVLFTFYKFRTMRVGTPNIETEKFTDAKSYITGVGKMLRKTSLDELPQLINILKGDMTFIGPRPALFNQYDLKKLRTNHGVHRVLPGVTGWAQINGRDQLTTLDKVRFDAYYVQNQSVAFDMRILMRTFFKVIRCEGVIDGTKGKHGSKTDSKLEAEKIG